ncbi:hypothetical protein EHS25_010118 [Saitozyma podzolica]|uniref:Uncharacterized protein n=1 Tax=Saitozyma podzolica TaxID=1890683 RepID=A0A427YIN0_9TREE|nr:hypothetical protein EHS25_010118 [Saitozyma podzolica]
MYNETYEQEVKNAVVGSVGNGVGIGALLLGPWTAVLLYGMCIHLFLHWLAHAADTERRLVKITVYWLAFASTGTVGFYIWWDFWLFVQNFGSYVGFADQRFPPSIWVIEIVNRTPVTAFFAERAWRLVGKSKVFLVVMCTLMTTSVVGAVGSRASVPAEVLLKFPKNGPLIPFICLWPTLDEPRATSPPLDTLRPVYLLREVLTRAPRPQLVSQLLSDIIVTSAISYKLIRSRTGWTATDRLVRKLLVLLVETQLPPTVWYVATVQTCPNPPAEPEVKRSGTSRGTRGTLFSTVRSYGQAVNGVVIRVIGAILVKRPAYPTRVVAPSHTSSSS